MEVFEDKWLYGRGGVVEEGAQLASNFLEQVSNLSAAFNFLEQVRRCGVTCILCIVSLLSERQCTVTRTNRDPQALKKGPSFL